MSIFIVQQKILADWQMVVDLMAEQFNVPAALIMRLAQDDIEVFVASHGADNPYRPGQREPFHQSGLYCETVIKTKSKLLVPNARLDEHWKNNPDIKLTMIAYLGYPIFLPNGDPFGTLCVLDNKANRYSPLIERAMEKYRDLIQSHLALTYMNHVLHEENKSLLDFINELRTLRNILPMCSSCKKIRDENGRWLPPDVYLKQREHMDVSHGLCPDCGRRLYPDLQD